MERSTTVRSFCHLMFLPGKMLQMFERINGVFSQPYGKFIQLKNLLSLFHMNFPPRDTSTVVTNFKDQNSKHCNPVFKESITVVNSSVFC